MRHIQRYLFIKRYVLPSGIAILILTALWPRISQSQDNPPGASLSGLNPGDRKLFDVGRDGFLEIESVAAGLGPAFNGTSCAGCHNQPAIGGFGNAAVIRAGTIWNGRYRVPQGGDLVHFFSIPDHACQPGVPADANNVIHRIPTPLFGAGLVEAIPDSAIEALADPTDRNGDGIHGRIAFIMDPATQTIRVGRFGWKAQHATLLAFAANAYRDEMGITNDLYPEEIGTGLSPGQLAACDTVPDPEDKRDPITHLRDIDNLANFMRFLAPIEPLPQSGNLRRGAELFSAVGCVFCHVPALQTGPSPIAALDRIKLASYSDFLLHDIGTGDGVEQGAAMGTEFRTAPLWGLRFRKLLLHDGRALSPTDAIKAHRNEADGVRAHFDQLSDADQRAVVDFLATL